MYQLCFQRTLTLFDAHQKSIALRENPTNEECKRGNIYFLCSHSAHVSTLLPGCHRRKWKVIHIVCVRVCCLAYGLVRGWRFVPHCLNPRGVAALCVCAHSYTLYGGVFYMGMCCHFQQCSPLWWNTLPSAPSSSLSRRRKKKEEVCLYMR